MIIELQAKTYRQAMEQLDELFEAKKKFIAKVNKKPRSKYQELVIQAIEKYEKSIHDTFQALRDDLKTCQPWDYGQISREISSARDRLNALRAAYLTRIYPIGRERALSDLRRKGLIQEAASDWKVKYVDSTWTDPNGDDHDIQVPEYTIPLTPMDDVDLQRVDDMIDGTEYSKGLSRYTGFQRGPFVDAQMNKMNQRLTQQDDVDSVNDDWNDSVDEEVDGMDSKSYLWGAEAWATAEKAAMNEWSDWEKETGNTAQYAWAGPYDDATCDYCAEAMDNSPYDSIDDTPEPGEGDCMCNCRHGVVLVGGGDENE